MSEMKLSPNQIRNLQEIQLDKETASKTLRIALNHHSNVLNELIKKEKAMWDEFTTQFGLDIKNNSYMIDTHSAFICVVEQEKSKKEVNETIKSDS